METDATQQPCTSDEPAPKQQEQQAAPQQAPVAPRRRGRPPKQQGAAATAAAPPPPQLKGRRLTRAVAFALPEEGEEVHAEPAPSQPPAAQQPADGATGDGSKRGRRKTQQHRPQPPGKENASQGKQVDGVDEAAGASSGPQAANSAPGEQQAAGGAAKQRGKKRLLATKPHSKELMHELNEWGAEELPLRAQQPAQGKEGGGRRTRRQTQFFRL